MAFNIIKNSLGTAVQADRDLREILIDSADDLEDIPRDTAPGSVAYTPGMTLMYMKGNDGTWTRIGGS